MKNLFCNIFKNTYDIHMVVVAEFTYMIYDILDFSFLVNTNTHTYTYMYMIMHVYIRNFCETKTN